MRAVDFRTVAEVIGLVSVVASLVFVGVEVRQSRQAALDQSIASDVAIRVELMSLIAEAPDVWARGCKDEPLTDAEAVVFSATHHALVMQRFEQWMRITEGLTTASTFLAVDNVAMNIHRNPGFRREWEAHRRLRAHLDRAFDLERFRAAVDARVAEFQEFEPEPLVDVSRCGLN